MVVDDGGIGVDRLTARRQASAGVVSLTFLRSLLASGDSLIGVLKTLATNEYVTTLVRV